MAATTEDERWLTVLSEMRVDFARRLDCTPVLRHLLARRILTEDDRQEVTVAGTQRKQADQLVTVLGRKSENEFLVFIEILKHSDVGLADLAANMEAKFYPKPVCPKRPADSMSLAPVAMAPLTDAAQDVPVRVCLPDRLHKWHLVQSLDTTADLLHAMRRLRPDLAIGDVSWGERWLTAAANWQRLRLTEDWHMTVGAQLQLHARPSAVVMTVWSPHAVDEGRIVRLKAEESAGQALEAARRICTKVKIEENAVINAQELLYEIDGRQRRSVKCYDTAESKFLYVDVDCKRPAEVSSSSFIVRRCLSTTSALPASPLYMPAFIIETEMQLLQMTADRQIEAAAPAAMTDPSFVAFIAGIKCGEHPAKFYWKIKKNKFVDSLSGVVFANLKEIPDEGQRSHATCLLRKGDQPPFCRVPEGESLQVFCRVGVEVSIEEDRLQATKPLLPCDIERWLLSNQVDKFQKDFTASARRAFDGKMT